MSDISIIVPVYKAEKFIGRCIESILAQTFTGFELLLIDDGTPDRSGKICDEYASKDNRIRVIHKENGGVSDARNAGLNSMTGSYVAFIDSDDYIHPDMIKILYEKMVIYDADISICGITYVDEDGVTREESGRTILKDGDLDKMEALSGINDHMELGVICNKLYKTRLFNDIRFPSGKIHEDSFVLPKLYYKCRRIITTPVSLYYYVRNPNSITNSALSIRNYDLVESYFEKIKFFEDQGLQELLPDASKQIIDQYIRYTDRIDIRSAEEKKRQRDVKRMVRYCCLKHGSSIRIADMISFEMPKLFHFLRWIKTKYTGLYKDGDS